MNRFIKTIILFFIPIVIFLLVLETITWHIPNSYSYKYCYIKQHGSNIEAIAIGHSQLYDGFKPESFAYPSFNLSNSAQTYFDNYYLLNEVLKYLPNLKMVIMPIGYMNVDIKESVDLFSERACYYYKYMNIDYDRKLPLKERFECLDVKRAIQKCLLYYVQHGDVVGCDSMGRRNTNTLANRKHDLGYDRMLEMYTVTSPDSTDYCIGLGEYLEKSLELLNNYNIEVVLVSPPYYWDSGFKEVNYAQKRFIKSYICQLQNSYKFYYLDLESDSSFTYDDFFNETHLSELGAEKFTKLLNDTVSKYIDKKQ